MSVDVGLDKQDRSASIDALRKVLGETYALYFKTHGYHWNVTGPRFKALHELFMEQYTELWQALDELAERIRALGEFAPASSDEIASYATIKPDNGVPVYARTIAPHAHDTRSSQTRGSSTGPWTKPRPTAIPATSDSARQHDPGPLPPRRPAHTPQCEDNACAPSPFLFVQDYAAPKLPTS